MLKAAIKLPRPCVRAPEQSISYIVIQYKDNTIWYLDETPLMLDETLYIKNLYQNPITRKTFGDVLC